MIQKTSKMVQFIYAEALNLTLHKYLVQRRLSRQSISEAGRLAEMGRFETGSKGYCMAIGRTTRQGLFWLTAITMGLLLITWACEYWNLDLLLSARFYSQGTGHGWFLREAQPWRFLREYGTIPGLALGICSLLVWCLCTFKDKYHHLQRHFLLIVLTTLIGSGLLVNAVFKSYWGRPRPSQIEQFGGFYDYRPAYLPGTPGKGESFPSGHSSMGFLFISLLVWRKKQPLWAYGGAAFGIFAGALLGTARIVQGAHFLSDIVWSFGVMALTAMVLHFFVLRIPDLSAKSSAKAASGKQNLRLVVGVVLAMGVFTFAFMTRRPYYESFWDTFGVDATKKISITLKTPPESKRILYKDIQYGWIFIHSRGFGWPSAVCAVKLRHLRKNGTLILEPQIEPKGYFKELNHQLEIWLPLHTKDRLVLEAGKD